MQDADTCTSVMQNVHDDSRDCAGPNPVLEAEGLERFSWIKKQTKRTTTYTATETIALFLLYLACQINITDRIITKEG